MLHVVLGLSNLIVWTNFFQVNDDNLPGTSSGVVENFWKPLDEDSKRETGKLFISSALGMKYSICNALIYTKIGYFIF